MHQDIKTFSDLQDINTRDQLLIRLVLRKHGQINYRVRINDINVEADVIELLFDLLEPLVLEFTVLDLVEGTSGIEIVEFSVNRHEILPKYKHQFTTDAYLDQVGQFSYCVPAPFYPWYHSISGQGWLA